MKFSLRASKVSNHSSQLTCRRFWESPPKSKRRTPRWSPCSVPWTVAGTPLRSSAHFRITSWLVVARLGVLPVGDLQPPGESGLRDPEAPRDLSDRLVALPGDRDHVAPDLLRERLEHDADPSSGAAASQARS